jgi:integrase
MAANVTTQPERKDRPRLTGATLRAAKPEETPYELRSERCPGLLLRVQPSGAQTYWVQVGRGKRTKLGDAKVLALDQAVDRARRVLVDPAAYAKEKHKAATLESFIDDHYKPWALAHLKTADDTLRRLKSSFGKKFYAKRLDEIRLPDVERWRTDAINAGLAKATVNRNLVALRSVLSKAVEWNALDAHPLRGFKPLQVANEKTRFLSPQEEQRLRTALAERDANMRQARDSANEWRAARERPVMPKRGTYADHLTPMTLLSLNTGMRRGEVFNLLWEDVDFKHKLLAVRADVAKSGKLRHINLNKEAMGVLAEWQKTSGGKTGLVFPGKNGGPFVDVKNSFGGLLTAAKINGFRWHDLRHHFASRFVMAGGDLNTLRELLGHADIKMVLRYAHLSSEHKAAAVERISGGKWK